MIKTTHSPKQTIELGKKFSKIIKPNDLVVFEGELGGGKTTFIKGVLQGLGYKGKVLSPTFNLIRQYRIKKLIVYHIDLYRLDPAKDFAGLGFEDIFYADNTISLIEWGQKIEDQLPRFHKLEFKHKSDQVRLIRISKKI